MKLFSILLGILFIMLQYKLWFEKDNFWRLRQFKQQVTTQRQENVQLSQRNENLLDEIRDLKIGKSALEAHARNDLNMVKSDELYYLIITDDKKH